MQHVSLKAALEGKNINEQVKANPCESTKVLLQTGSW